MFASRIVLSITAAGFALAVGTSAQTTAEFNLKLQAKAAAKANLLATRVALASSAFQEEVTIPEGLQLTNKGELLPVISTGHVLTVNPMADGSTGSILYAPSEADDPAYRAAISAGAGGATVDYFDARIATPSVATMSAYDAVHTWVNFDYLDPTGFGNNLAVYNDAGGTVVLGAFCTYTTGNFLAGTIMTAAYCPVDSPFGNNHFTLSPYTGDGTTCIYDGVAALNCQFRDFLVTQGTGITDGTYADGEICHAYRGGTTATQGEVVYSNGSGAIQLAGTGQWGTAVGNSCSCPLTAVVGGGWTDEGSGLAGVSGVPKLVGEGTMASGSLNTVHLSNANANAPTWIFSAPSSVPTSFKGGTLLPDPSASLTFGRTSASGEAHWEFTVPGALPSGSEIWVQWAIQDGAAVKLVALSNAVKGTKP